MLFCFSECNQLKLLREIMKKYQLDNNVHGSRSLIIFRQYHCLIKFMNIQTKLDYFFVSNHGKVSLHFHIVYSCNKNWSRHLFQTKLQNDYLNLLQKEVIQCVLKKILFHKLVKSLNFASKKYNLRNTEDLKLSWNGIFFFFKNSTAIKKIFQILRFGGNHEK